MSEKRMLRSGSNSDERRAIVAVAINAMMLMVLQPSTEAAPAQVPAMFVFGDSLVDCGNNNYLSSLARANYYPYGCDFNGGATGRFSNGRTVADMLGALLGLPYVPAFANPTTTGNRILGGVNYASAAAGILDETGQHFGQRFSLSQQVVNFETTVNEGLRRLMSGAAVSQHLSKSIAVLVFGSNDYINNYLLAPLYNTSYTYNPADYATLLLNRYARQLLALHAVGLRKFFVAGVGPLGCIPNQRASGRAPPGRCVDDVNRMVGPFNEGLRSMVDILNRNHPGAVFAYGNTYAAFGDILNNPGGYGFRVIDRACCGIGRNQGQITCMPLQMPCSDRKGFAFWDAFHTTDQANAVLAWRAYLGSTSDCYPINVHQMAQL